MHHFYHKKHSKAGLPVLLITSKYISKLIHIKIHWPQSSLFVTTLTQSHIVTLGTRICSLLHDYMMWLGCLVSCLFWQLPENDKVQPRVPGKQHTEMYLRPHDKTSAFFTYICRVQEENNLLPSKSNLPLPSPKWLLKNKTGIQDIWEQSA